MIDPEITHTIFFADLAGFTALTEAMGETDATDLAHDFDGPWRRSSALRPARPGTRPVSGGSSTRQRQVASRWIYLYRAVDQHGQVSTWPRPAGMRPMRGSSSPG